MDGPQADLGAGEILKYPHLAPLGRGQLPDELYIGQVARAVPVGEIEAGDIEAALDHGPQDLWRGRGRADGRHDFCLAEIDCFRHNPTSMAMNAPAINAPYGDGRLGFSGPGPVA